MSEANDELISAYMDGRLNVSERAAFESREQHEAGLRQQMQVTRLVAHTASQLPPLPLPRSFVLPAAMAVPEKPARPSWDLRALFRLGSAFAAALFVLLVGLDLRQLASPAAVVLTPNALATFVPNASSAQSATELPLSLSTRAIQPQNTLPALSADAFTPRAAIANTMVANEIAAARAVSAEAETGAQLLTATPAPAQTVAPVAAAPLTPVPTLSSVVTMPQANATWPLTRMLAGISLIIGAVLAVLGWRR